MKSNKLKVIETAKGAGSKLSEKEELTFQAKYSNDLPVLEVNNQKKFQQFIGFGGSFTEAGSTTLDQLSPENRQEAIDAYFHPDKGINYTFCRTHINSCDFSLGNYAYTETPGDVELKDFTIERDRNSLIPLIKDALKTTNEDIKLFASPWSPPAWMKTNGRMNNGGSLKKEYYDVWARYFAKYIKEYQKEDIDIWGVTIQNEPMAVTPWDNCVYNAEQERDFVKVLGPTLKEEGLGDKKIIVWDHNKDIMKERMDVMFQDEEAAKWVWGAGFHWYGNDDAMNLMDNSVLDYTYENYDTNLVFTEGCNPLHGDKPFLNEWWTGEKYGANIINDLNHWTAAWCDWNMFLNEEGGPNHVNNFCDAPIIADTTTNELYYNSSYYYMAHFSKYILPGAYRIEWTSEVEDLEVTSFENKDGEIVIVIMNQTDNDKKFILKYEEKGTEINIKPHAIQTLIINS